RADRRADRDFAAFDKANIVVPQGEPTRPALVPELQVRDPAPGAVLAGERADRRNRDDGGPEVRLNPLFEVGDPRERGDAPPEALDDDHRGGLTIQQASPFRDDGVQTGFERFGAQQVLDFFVVRAAHGRSSRVHTKGLLVPEAGAEKGGSWVETLETPVSPNLDSRILVRRIHACSGPSFAARPGHL